MKLASGGMAKYYTSFVFKSDASVQAELVSCYRHRPVFWRLSNEMSERGHCVHSVAVAAHKDGCCLKHQTASTASACFMFYAPWKGLALIIKPWCYRLDCRSTGEVKKVTEWHRHWMNQRDISDDACHFNISIIYFSFLSASLNFTHTTLTPTSRCKYCISAKDICYMICSILALSFVLPPAHTSNAIQF